MEGPGTNIMDILALVLQTLTEIFRHLTDSQTKISEELSLQPEASWLKAIYKNLSNQNLYNNIVKELLNGILREKSILTEFLYWMDIQQAIFSSNAFISSAGQLAGVC